MSGYVVAVSRSASHTFSKPTASSIRLVEGSGVEGDAHQGGTVKHRWDVKRNAGAPNLRQVHLIHAELHDELREGGFDILPGEMGENITTMGVPLLSLPTGTRLRLGAHAVVEITGLRHPCVQLDRFRSGLQAAVLGRDERGDLVRKTGVMGIVIRGGDVTPGDPIRVALPVEPHRSLQPV
jgi:MOSC domain-containing protein YiiM